EGFLESRPRAGTRVRLPSPDDVVGHYLVREALEVQAAIVFTRVAAPSTRAALSRLGRRVDALALKTNRLPYLALHRRLHQAIAEGTRSAALCDALERTHALASIWLGAMRRGSEDDMHRHAQFVEDVISGEVDKAAQAVREHLAISKERSMRLLEPYFRLRSETADRFGRGKRKTHQERHRTRA